MERKTAHGLSFSLPDKLFLVLVYPGSFLGEKMLLDLSYFRVSIAEKNQLRLFRSFIKNSFP